MRLHCLSAFRPPGSAWRDDVATIVGFESPLPFGVPAPRLAARSAEAGEIWALSPLPFGVPAPRLINSWRDDVATIVVSIAFRRSGPPALRPLNPLAGRVARAVQVTTAGLGHFGTSPRRACTRVNLHNSLAFGQFALRSGAGLFWRSLGLDLIRGSRGLFRSRPSCRRSWFLWRSGRQSCRRRCGPRLRQFWTEAGARTR